MKKIIILNLLIITCLGSLKAQVELSSKSKRAKKNYEMAENKYRQYFFKDALFYLDEALKHDSVFIEVYLLKADYYKRIKKAPLEIKNLEKVMEINPNFFTYTAFNLGVAYYNNGEYNKSKTTLNNFLNEHKVRKSTVEKANSYIKKCDVAIAIKANPVNFSPKNLGSGINTMNNEYWPSISLDGNTMIYTVLLTDSTRTFINGEFMKQEDFYISNFKNNTWQKGKPLGKPLNTPGNEGAHKISADGNTIVFTGCNRPRGYGNCDIYFSYKINGEWTEPENAGRSINTRYSEKQPSLSPDGRYLYFSSNRPKGMGGMDLWVAKRISDKQWETPVNLGDVINTTGNEVSPFIHSDNQTLYFSSNGHEGMGEHDIFYTKKDSNKNWQKPKNIGYPINTHLDEIGLTIAADGKTTYYATDCNAESTDIYSFIMPENTRPIPVSYITGRIYDKQSNKNLSAEFFLMNNQTEDTIMQSKSEDGNYMVCLPTGNNYAFNIDKKGYLFHSVNFDLTKTHSAEKPYKLDIPLTKINVGEVVILKNIFFKTDSYNLLPQSAVELKKILDFAKLNSQLILEIRGHTDNVGNADYNLKLSEKRAKAVYDYLVNNGVSKNRLSYKGYGQNIPVTDNNSAENRAKNRRTELKITGKL